MKAYDILVILKAHLGEEGSKAEIDNLKSWITGNEGSITLEDEYGTTDMPLTFKPATQGYYYNMQFEGTNKTLRAIEEKIAVNENFLRHLVVTMDSIVDKNAKVEEKEEA